MDFIFGSVALPVWLVVFIVGCALPLWIKWYRAFYQKYIVTGILQKNIRKAKSTAEMKMDILKKATANWDSDSDLEPFPAAADEEALPTARKVTDKDKKQHIRAALKELANSGETGVLARSVSDVTGIATINVTYAMNYLINKKYVEQINGPKGVKYYLTNLGRKYCINKKYISE